jgi:5-formyltetrahydrofolate cyclo-ligase
MATTTEIDALTSSKATLRHEMAERRRRAAAEAPPSAPLQARDHFLSSIPRHPGAVVSAFWPLPDEFDTKPLMRALHDAGHPIGLPVVQKRGLPLKFRLWTPETKLARSNFSVEFRRSAPVRPEILVVLLLAFDRKVIGSAMATVLTARWPPCAR